MFLFACLRSFFIGWLISFGLFLVLGLLVQDLSIFYSVIFGLSVTLCYTIAVGIYRYRCDAKKLKQEQQLRQQKEDEKNQVKYVIIK